MQNQEVIRVVIIDPMGAVRQSRRDAWDPSPAVARYRAYRDELRLKIGKFKLGPELPFIRFYLPMPKSWSQKKRTEMGGQPHQSKPDLDNLIKAFKDALAVEDAHVWRYAGAEKLWGSVGAIHLHPEGK